MEKAHAEKNTQVFIKNIIIFTNTGKGYLVFITCDG